MAVDEYFNKYAEADSNILADRTKLMTIEEFRMEIISLIEEMIEQSRNWKLYDSPSIGAFDKGYRTALIELEEKLNLLKNGKLVQK